MGSCLRSHRCSLFCRMVGKNIECICFPWYEEIMKKKILLSIFIFGAILVYKTSIDSHFSRYALFILNTVVALVYPWFLHISKFFVLFLFPFSFARTLLPLQDVATLQTVQHRSGYSKVNNEVNWLCFRKL